MEKDCLTQLIKNNVFNRTPEEKKFFKIRKLKVFVGKGLLVYSALPLFSFWAAIPGMMLIGIKPTLWAKVKLNDFKQWWVLR